MTVLVNFNNTGYLIPSVGETGWGQVLTNYLADLGANTLTTTNTANVSNKTISLLNGSVAAPSLNFASSTNTGMYSPSTGLLNLASNGVDRLKIDGSGNITVTGALAVTGAVTAASLVGSLTNATLTNPTVSGGTLTNPAITGGTHASAAITGGSIASAAISGGTIANATITNGSITTATITSPTLTGTISGNVTATGSINASVGLSNTQSGLAQFMSADANLGYLSIGAGWAWRFDRVQGNMSWNNSAGTPLEGWNAGGHWFCGDQFYAITANASQRIFAFANTWYWLWATGTGDLSWNQGGLGLGFMFRVSDGLSYSARGPGGGNGAYSNISDAGVKTDLREAEHGLTHVCALTPQRYRRTTSATPDREEIGFTAQDVQKSIPEAVHNIGTTEKPLLAMQLDPVVAALVNAVKELAGEIAELKRGAKT